MSIEHTHAAGETLAREAHSLDSRDWDAWLDLYTEDAIFWVPAWKSEHQTTESPNTELSLIYLSGRSAMEERIARIRSGLSVASMPLPRTTHLITSVLLEPRGVEDRLQVASNWSVQIFQPKRNRQHTFFGSYSHILCHRHGEWRISSKTVVLKNDVIPALIDFYCL